MTCTDCAFCPNCYDYRRALVFMEERPNGCEYYMERGCMTCFFLSEICQADNGGHDCPDYWPDSEEVNDTQ